MADLSAVKLFPNGTASFQFFGVDCFEWLAAAASDCIHVVGTNPPYGPLEYMLTQSHNFVTDEVEFGAIRLHSAEISVSGPSLYSLYRPRATEPARLFERLGACLLRVLIRGALIYTATDPLVSNLVFELFMATGFEKRGEFIRAIQTIKVGERPKNAHEKFMEVRLCLARAGRRAA